MDDQIHESFKLIGALSQRYGVDTSTSIPLTLFRLVLAMANDLPPHKEERGRPESVKSSRKDYRLIGLVRFHVELEGESISGACRKIFENGGIEITDRTTPESIRVQYNKFLRALKLDVIGDPRYISLFDGMQDAQREKFAERIALNQAMDEYGLGGIYKLDEALLHKSLSK